MCVFVQAKRRSARGGLSDGYTDRSHPRMRASSQQCRRSEPYMTRCMFDAARVLLCNAFWFAAAQQTLVSIHRRCRQCIRVQYVQLADDYDDDDDDDDTESAGSIQHSFHSFVAIRRRGTPIDMNRPRALRIRLFRAVFCVCWREPIETHGTQSRRRFAQALMMLLMRCIVNAFRNTQIIKHTVFISVQYTAATHDC